MERSKLSERLALVGVTLAAVFAAWLRLFHLDRQVPVDDEWHAIHKLMSASYGEIFRSFGFADHSIPLTLLYKAMANTIGLDEIDMHALQVACGVGLVVFSAWLAWRATTSAGVAVLFAFLLANAPLQVLYSRFARPYAIATLLEVLALAALWRWRERPSPALGAAICALTALTAWLHPLTVLFPLTAMGSSLPKPWADGVSATRAGRSCWGWPPA
jgi:predicted membrane-bound mannosyltransferase